MTGQQTAGRPLPVDVVAEIIDDVNAGGARRERWAGTVPDGDPAVVVRVQCEPVAGLWSEWQAVLPTGGENDDPAGWPQPGAEIIALALAVGGERREPQRMRVLRSTGVLLATEPGRWRARDVNGVSGGRVTRWAVLPAAATQEGRKAGQRAMNPEECDECQGMGTVIETCPRCSGNGCPDCDDSGEIEEDCPECDGSGRIETTS